MQNAKLQLKIKDCNFLILLLILALAVFFRFYQLEQIPPGIYPDEALNANQAITEPGKIFYPDNNGREGLFINLLWLSFSLYGVSLWSFRIVPALFGTLTVLGTYLLARELFSQAKSQIPNSKRFGIWNLEFGISRGDFIALLSSFFVATSFWHVNFSRIGFRAILLPFVLVFSFYFLWRGFRTKNWPQIILGGTLFGLGFYTYTSFRMAVLLLGVFLLLWLLIYIKQEQIKKFIILSAAGLITIFLIALPIGLYFLENPDDFAERALPVSVFSQENPAGAFAESLVRHLAMFNIAGDPNWRHNYSGSPQLLWPVGLLFLVGIAVSLKRILADCRIHLYHSSTAKTFQDYTEYWNVFAHIFLFSWLLTMLLPGALTYEGLPHALRTIGVIPAVYILAAVGGVAAYDFLRGQLAKKFSDVITSVIIFVITFLFIAAMVGFGFYDYFIKWAKNPNVQDAFTQNYVEIGNYLNSLSNEVKKYVIMNEYGHPLWGISIPAQTPMFIERAKYGSLRAEYIKAEQLSEIQLGPDRTVIIPLYPESVSEPLQKIFPQAIPYKINDITVFKISF